MQNTGKKDDGANLYEKRKLWYISISKIPCFAAFIIINESPAKVTEGTASFREPNFKTMIFNKHIQFANHNAVKRWTMENPKQTFALDIGTRTIVGIIWEERDNRAEIKHCIVKEHQERAMLDGQIHDITSVARVIREVKEELERKCGPLKRACVAAAGRTLKTEQAAAKMETGGRPIRKEDVIHLELMAVQKAEQQVAEKFKGASGKFFCVGYSVLYYYLDGEQIGNLVGQNGSEASVEIIATFLPKVVIDSLSSALNRAGLEMEAITLEPIAAIHVLIPPSMRRLNVALVDIGAGTSDIAVTDKGTIINYGMVPIAGDEITEAISDQFLIDFPVAEQVKIQLSAKDTVTVKDILGFELTLEKDEIIRAISPAIEQLADTIAREILRLNHQHSPKAVMLVGGGSLTPNLPELLAEKLQLPKNRVAIRQIDALENVIIPDERLRGPEFVTPIGIGISAKKNPLQYKTVFLNGQPVHLFEIKKLTVADALLASGLKISQLYGKPGLAKIIRFNGKAVAFPGKFGSPPKIFVNGEPASVDDEIREGAEITVEKGDDGEDAKITVEELMKEGKISLFVNDQEYSLFPSVEVNGKKADKRRELKDRDIVQCRYAKTIGEALAAIGLKELLKEAAEFAVTVNNERKRLPKFSGKILKNGAEATPETPIQAGDRVTVTRRKNPTVEELASEFHWVLEQDMPVTFNGKPVLLSKRVTFVRRDGKLLDDKDRVKSGDVLTVERAEDSPFIFQDVFRFVDYSTGDKRGNYKILRNGKEGTFQDRLTPGDKLEIIWPDQ